MGEQLLPCRLLVSLLLLSALMNCKNIGYASSNATLPPEEVDAINAVLQLTSQPGLIEFKNSDCGVKLKDSVSCVCNKTTCKVTQLDFSYSEMIGEIPMQIGNLTSLTSFYFGGNFLEGRIPTFFGGMKSLVTLSLRDNNFNGTIPPELDTLPSLQELYLSGNWLSGNIPHQLGNISNLVALDLSDNLLFGEIPPHLGNLSNLQTMYFYDNQLSGELPSELGNLTNLESMLLTNNDFSGNLPRSFGGLKNMSYFNVRGNNFSGKIPDFIADWKSLYSLVLDGNNFEWPDREVFQSLTNLYTLRLVGLTGGHRGERNFPRINASKYLTTLVLRNSSLGGPIPDFVSQYQLLNHLDLSFNNLTGEIPLFNLQYLQYLFLRGNKLNKASRGWLSHLQDSYVDVSENLLTNLNLLAGTKVSKNWNFFSCCSGINNTNDKWQNAGYSCDSEKPMYNQLYINCGGDSTTICTTPYEADSKLDGGSTFFLSRSKSWGYSSMGQSGSSYIVQNTSDVNMDDATLYTTLYTTARVAPISLKYFGFCLKDGNYTVKLHFAEISWNTNKEPGNVGIRIFDVEIQRIKVLTNFNIIKEAGGVNKAITKVFNDVAVNDNKLEIHLYWTGKGSFISSLFPNVGPLISAISVSSESSSLCTTPVKKLSALSIAGIVASALLVPILILAILWKLGWFGRKQLQDEELKGIELLPGTFFNFQQIKAATQNFSSANKLGEGGFGSVYKGVLPNGTTIAVKQLSTKSRQGIREFVNEVGTISALKHPNLVMLLGCCAEDNQLLLIYEYMENNSLAHALFGPEELRSRLNWPTRVKICLGIAKGLAFLHEESKLKIVHRDIKPTNILLDTDLNAKISDFGLAKLYEGEMTNVTTRIAGTTGYMAPEYAMRGHLTSKADVYSFGVVTLEIVSGKNSASYRPNDENVYLLDLAYVLQQKGNIIKLVDPTLGSNYSSEQAVTILELAMLCTNQSPSLRPAMSEVVKILEGKSKIAATPVSSPYSMDDSMMGLFYSTSQEGTSNANSSQAVSKEVEEWPLLDDWRTTKSVPDFPRSTKFYSSSQEGTSNANRSQAISKEFEKSKSFF